MDGLAPQSADDLEALYKTAWTQQWGTTVGDGFHRLSFLRSKARQLAEYFDVNGWPSTQEEILTYVQRTLERYG
jgi:hypothetical protein